MGELCYVNYLKKVVLKKYYAQVYNTYLFVNYSCNQGD